jgi:type VI secretion system protein ImpJ
VAWDSKVLWTEGLFLQPQHLQQADRYVEQLVSGAVRRIGPYLWGVSELEIDEEVLKFGKFAIRSASGLTPDGAVFRVPQAEPHPPALDVPQGVKDCVVHLTVPARRHGAIEVDLSGADHAAARYRADEIEVTDSMGRDRRPVTVAVGKLRLGFALDIDELADQLVIPVARIIEVRADREVVLDRAFVPACLDIRAAPPLAAFLRELEGLLGHRMTALAGRLGEGGPGKGGAEISDFLLLMAVNRTLPVARHLLELENVHPARLYELCVSLAGELAAFMTAEKAAPEFPPYQHANLAAVFAPVMRLLRQYLRAVLERTAVPIPLEARKFGVSVGVIADRRLVSGADFVLAAKADVPAEQVRRYFANQTKVGPTEEIRQLVNSALPGIALRPLPAAPRQLPYHAGVVYFELDRDSPYWSKITTTGGIAVHVPTDFPGLKMELWAIRQG